MSGGPLVHVVTEFHHFQHRFRVFNVDTDDTLLEGQDLNHALPGIPSHSPNGLWRIQDRLNNQEDRYSIKVNADHSWSISDAQAPQLSRVFVKTNQVQTPRYSSVDGAYSLRLMPVQPGVEVLELSEDWLGTTHKVAAVRKHSGGDLIGAHRTSLDFHLESRDIVFVSLILIGYQIVLFKLHEDRTDNHHGWLHALRLFAHSGIPLRAEIDHDRHRATVMRTDQGQHVLVTSHESSRDQGLTLHDCLIAEDYKYTINFTKIGNDSFIDITKSGADWLRFKKRNEIGMPVFELLHEGPPVILDVYHKHGEWWVEVKDREDGRRSVVAKRRVQPDGKIELLFAVNDLAHAARTSLLLIGLSIALFALHEDPHDFEHGFMRQLNLFNRLTLHEAGGAA